MCFFITIGVVEAPGTVLRDGHHPSGIWTIIKAVNARRVASEFKCFVNFLKLARPGENNLPDSHFRRKSYQEKKTVRHCIIPILFCFFQLKPEVATNRPSGEILAE